MAKKRGRPKAAEKNVTPVALSIRGRPEWREWLESVANAERINSASVVDQALAEWAKKRNLNEPPRRL